MNGGGTKRGIAEPRGAFVHDIAAMDLRAMAVVARAITAERLAPAGERVARAIGAVGDGAGMFLIARAAGVG